MIDGINHANINANQASTSLVSQVNFSSTAQTRSYDTSAINNTPTNNTLSSIKASLVFIFNKCCYSLSQFAAFLLRLIKRTVLVIHL